MIKAKLILTIGISGSGKTTWANEQIKNDPENIVNVNRDDTRMALFFNGDYSNYSNYEFSYVNENLITKVCHDKIKLALAKGLTVIVSDTNITRKFRRKLQMIAFDYDSSYEEKVFEVPLETCIERQLNRDFQVPENVIRSQYQKMRDEGYYIM